MAKEFQRKLYVIDYLNDKGQWERTNYGDYNHAYRPRMLRELAKAREQYPDEKYKLTTYVPQEPARKRLNARVTQKKKKTKRQRR